MTFEESQVLTHTGPLAVDGVHLNQAAGWYPDPAHRVPDHFRYWDGQSWTDHTITPEGGVR